MYNFVQELLEQIWNFLAINKAPHIPFLRGKDISLTKCFAVYIVTKHPKLIIYFLPQPNAVFFRVKE